MSKIATSTAASLLALFAGQTVTADTVYAQITLEYTVAKKKPGFTSYFQVENICEAAGARTYYDGPDCTGQKYFTFPASAA